MNDIQNPVINDLIQRMVAKNPNAMEKMQLFAALMDRQADMASENERTHEAVKQKLIRIQNEHKILSERNKMLAAALGACPHCWGTDKKCKCQGLGAPGYKRPNMGLFSEIVIPVLEDHFELTHAETELEDVTEKECKLRGE